MKALVTGAAGFIGSHLVERLIDEGTDVVVLDNMSTGVGYDLDRLAALGKLDFVRGSVLDEPLIGSLVATADVVFHMAATVGVKAIVDDPIGALRTNLRGSEGVLEAARLSGTKVLVMSSSEVYGHNTADLLHEDSPRILGSPLAARSSYAEAKAVVETLAHSYWKFHGVPTVIVRPFSVVGPRQTGRFGMVIPRFVDAALAGEPITVFGDGNQTRCFCHVDDAVTAILGLSRHPGAVGEVFNVGRPVEVSIKTLAQRCIELTNSSSVIRHKPYVEAYQDGSVDMERRIPDISRVRDLIGFEPRLGLDDILRSVIASRGGDSGGRSPARSTPVALSAAGTGRDASR
ncbi:NAD-dependent epimerase/dehydratase family protein [Saccharopolyspora shandongensis]|uniref:NAD-dependent epimerase/dehydratase family protein n=1 Tax=Saccharopolyspora shandongensis TaxID=418495 RepID=UPI0033C94B3F